MEIIVKGVFRSIAACGGKVRFTFAIVFVGFLREDCIEIKNKEWNTGEKPEEKSLRITFTNFKGDLFKAKKTKTKTMTLLLSAASFILMPWCSKLLSAIFKATETLGGAPAIV